jgi:carbon-monoxide dehydrogenase medium subunit
LEEAVSLLERYKGEAKILAGGQSLIPLMKLRIVSPGHLIDLNTIKGLGYVKREGRQVVIGALTKMAEIEESEVLRKECYILSECAALIADPLVRNLGTIGGNVSHADPENDMPAIMVAMNAMLVAAGPGGKRRTIPATEFFLDTFTTALAEDEVLTEIRLPTKPHDGSAYLKLERQAGDFATVGVAALIRLDADGKCKECGLGLTGAGPSVVKASKAEASLVESKVDARAIETAARLASEASSPVADLRGSVEYKREMVKVMTKRALSLALKRARSGRAR